MCSCSISLQFILKCSFNINKTDIKYPLYYFMKNCGHEELAIEFKEFKGFLDKDSCMFSLKEKEIRKLIYYNFELKLGIIDKQIFNSNCLELLSKYIYQYVPKYAGNFTMSLFKGVIDTNCILKLGVSDDGMYKGIPSFSDITPNMIHRMITNMVANNECRCVKYNEQTDSIIVLNKSYLRAYFKKVIVRVNQLVIDETEFKHIIDSDLRLLKEKISANNKHKRHCIKYKQEMSIFKRYVKKYSRALCDYVINKTLMNETIKYIYDNFCSCDFVIDYIIKHNDKYDLSKLEEYKLKIIKMFDNQSELDNFVKLYNPPKQELNDIILRSSNEPLSYIYWLMQYKDYKTKHIRKLPSNDISRPIRPSPKPKPYMSMSNLFFNFVINKANTNAILLKLFPDIKLFCIDIEFPKCPKNIYIQYINANGEWNSKYRTQTQTGPGASP